MAKEYLNKKKSLTERKQLYKEEVTDKLMNPFDNFNPDNFDPLATNSEEDKLAKRVRLVPPKLLPLFGLKPKEIREGQMIGMYESKQDLYLIMAHRCNELQIELDAKDLEIQDLVDRIIILENNN